ncbi:MAG: ABC transporter substrate-binding protein [Chloroflexota bacterium]
MKNLSRITLVLAAVVLLVMPIAAQAQDDNTLRVGLRQLTTIDPALGANDPEVMFNQLQYEYLIAINADGNLEPQLATDWTISEDGLTYTLTLREGVTFEDGSAFDAADVVFTFNRLVEVGSSIVGLLGQEQVGEDDEGNALLEPTWAVEAADDMTVVFTLDQPNADFLFGVASRFSAILPEGIENVNVIADGDDPLVNFNGTGPFILTEFAVDERAVFVANPNYWGEVSLDGITLEFFADDQTQVNAIQTGALDFIIKIPNDLIPTVEGVDGVTVIQKATNTHPVIRLRTDPGSIGEDVRLRQAFKFATDREIVNLDVLDGNGVVGNNDPIGPSYGVFYNPQENRSYDPEAACALIAEVEADGTGNGFVEDGRVVVPFYIGDTFEYGDVGVVLQDLWAEACIDVDLNVVPENVYYGDGENTWLSTQVGMTAWGTRPVPQEYLSVAYVEGAPFNEAQWVNEELAALAAEASVTADTEARAELYNQISVIFLEEGPIIIPYFRPVAGAFVNSVEGLDMHPFPGRTDFRTVSISE